MKKLLMLLLAMCLLVALPTAAFAASPAKGKKGLEGQAGKSNNAFIELWEKDPATWDIVQDGAWGRMKYKLEGPEFNYHFNGHGLEIQTNYSLIYYPEPQTTWPWPVTVITSGMSNEDGDIHLKGSYELDMDLNDAKIWLVLTDDIVDGELSGWNPTEYLFEYDLISYNDTNI